MKNIIKKEEYLKIYTMLESVSPVDYDCGRLCDAACCTTTFEPEDIEYTASGDENADYYMGIYLLPGEEQVFTDEFGSHAHHDDWLTWGSIEAEDYEYPSSWEGKIHCVQCQNVPYCNRPFRPIQCRTFPLSPHISQEGQLEMIINCDELPYQCPLIESAYGGDGEFQLNEDFISVTRSAWEILIKDPQIYDLVAMDSQERIEDDAEIIVV